jgi:hypothetical protein
MYRTEGRMLRKMGASTALAVGLIAGGIGIASAATSSATPASATVATAPMADGPPGFHGEGAGGVVTAVTSSSLTVSHPDGTSSTFGLTSATTVQKAGASAAVSDLAVGERVDIRPSETSASVASDIEIQVPRIAGQVVSVTGSTIVLSDAQGFYRTLNVTSSTTYAKAAGSAATASDVVVGAFVMGEGSIAADHSTLSATIVVIGVPEGGPGHGPRGGPGDFHGDGPGARASIEG